MSLRAYANDQGQLFLVVRYGDAEDEVGPIVDGFETVAILAPSPVAGAVTNAKKLRRRSMKIEDNIAEAIGGRRHKGSGALAYAKGDVRKRGRLRVESKFTQAASYRVTLADLRKIDSECSFGETPAFDITFVEPGTLREIDAWVLIPRSEWQRLMEVDSAASDDR